MSLIDYRATLHIVESLRFDFRALLARRKCRPRTAMISVPLTMLAGWLTQQWWTIIPLGLCAWWWAERTWPWTWLVAVESGAFGSLWAYSGATALAQFPAYRIPIALGWIGIAAALALVSGMTRIRNRQLPNYPGY